jgi:hypothetical protein
MSLFTDHCRRKQIRMSCLNLRLLRRSTPEQGPSLHRDRWSLPGIALQQGQQNCWKISHLLVIWLVHRLIRAGFQVGLRIVFQVGSRVLDEAEASDLRCFQSGLRHQAHTAYTSPPVVARLRGAMMILMDCGASNLVRVYESMASASIKTLYHHSHCSRAGTCHTCSLFRKRSLIQRFRKRSLIQTSRQSIHHLHCTPLGGTQDPSLGPCLSTRLVSVRTPRRQFPRL